MKKVLIMMMCVIMVVCFMPTVAMASIENPKVFDNETAEVTLPENFEADGDDGAILAKNGANVTLNGEGKVHATLGPTNYSMAVWATGEGTKVVINGGEYTNQTDGTERGTDLIYASGNAIIEINGGTFKAAKTEWTLNCRDNTQSRIIVRGGKYYNFDPSNNTVGEGEIVVPETHKVIKAGDWYYVVKKGKVFDNETAEVTLPENFEADGDDGAILAKNGANVTLNGEGKVHATLGPTDYSMAVWATGEGTKVVINGGEYTNETDGTERGTDLIYASGNAIIEINGGTFKAAKTEWTLNCRDNTQSRIIVRGGKYYNFDPSNNTVGEGEIVVPETHKVIKAGDWYYVVKKGMVFDNKTAEVTLPENFEADGDDGAILATNGANVTLNGEGKVHATLGPTNYSMAVWATGADTKVVINGGEYTNETDGTERGTDLIYASGNAIIEINGGTFKAAKTEWTLNCRDKTESRIIVRGGKYYNFDPSHNTVGEGEIVVPETHKVIKAGDWYYVVEKTSGGGGGITLPPTTPTDNVTNSGSAAADNATTSADLSNTTSTSNGTTAATVDKTTADKIVDKAVENKSTEVVIDATANSTAAADSTTTAQVTIPTETLGAIAEKTEADVTIKTDVAEVKMDNAAAAAVSEQAEGDTVKIIAEKVKEDATEVHFELKVVCSNGTVISDFKGGNVSVTVTLPKTMAEKKLVCVYIDDQGHMSKVEGQKNADGTYTFTTTHFSTYAIMAEDEADAAIAAQTEAIKNIKIKLSSKQIKTKSGKKAVKVTWTAAAGDKVLDGVEVFRSKEKNKGYGTKAFFTSTKGGNKGSYINTKSLKKGTRYYYKVRGYVLVNGEKVYTDYSTKAWRTA